MSQLAEAFVLGNTAIVTNVCVLPLYPSMVAYLAADATSAGKAGPPASGFARASLGVLVLPASSR
jgi:cytochrome c biogenesis protein CcdA